MFYDIHLKYFTEYPFPCDEEENSRIAILFRNRVLHGTSTRDLRYRKSNVSILLAFLLTKCQWEHRLNGYGRRDINISGSYLLLSTKGAYPPLVQEFVFQSSHIKVISYDSLSN